MSDASDQTLSREKLQQLLATVGSQKTEPDSQVEAVEYDWNQPHYFNSEGLEKLDELANKMTAEIARKFALFYKSKFEVTIASITQHYAAEFLNQSSEDKQQDYLFLLMDEQNNPCGVIGMTAKTALIWLTLLLGDSESEGEPGRDLSQLEKSLLLDIAHCFSEAICNSHEVFKFHPAKGLSLGRFPLQVEDSAELCKLTFNFTKDESDYSGEAFFLVRCNRLEQIVGTAEADKEKLSAKDVEGAIVEHLKRIPVLVTARLASTGIKFEQIVSLQVDDILILDKKIGEPVELIVEGKTAFLGQPTKTAGKCSVLITGTGCSPE